MFNLRRSFQILIFAFWPMAGCGLYVPDKSPLVSGKPDEPADKFSPQALFEDKVVRHINCELSRGLVRANSAWTMPWLTSKDFGTAVTLTITAQQQSGANANVSIIEQFRNAITVFPSSRGGNIVTPQNLSLGLGVTAAANATRTETIQWTQRNSDLNEYYLNRRSDCSVYRDGIMLDSDLKIADFIYDKAQLVAQNNLTATTSVPKLYQKIFGNKIQEAPLFNTFTGEITFLGAFGGSVNPNIRLVSVNSGNLGNLIGAQNTYTSDIIITIGQLKPDVFPYQLGTPGLDQHQSRVNGNAIATSIQAQSR